MTLAAALVAALVAAAPSPFHDNRALPLAVRTLAVSHKGAVTVREISFVVDRTTREKAFLLVPRGAGPHPGIVFYPGRWQTRAWFLKEALADARRGAVAISLDDLSTGYPSFTLADRARLIERVVAGLRAIDLVAAQRGVDPKRLALVGHSDGAEIAGTIAGIDHRLRAVVLMSGGGVWDHGRTAAYNAAIAPLDADNWVRHAAPTALLFQNALSDEYVPRSDARTFQAAGSRPKTVRWYAATHVLNARAERDRQAWLRRELGF